MIDLRYMGIMFFSIVTGVALGVKFRSKTNIDPRDQLLISLGAFCGAMIGAKLPFVLADWDGLVSGAAWFKNGKTILFGLVGGYFGVEIVKKYAQIKVKTGDGFAVPVAVAIGIGRWSCYVAGCCYGTPTDLPWGVQFNDDLFRHPTQIYESIFHLTAAAILWFFFVKGMFQYQLIKLYILSYLIYRFCTEWIRPEAVILWGLTGYQWACLALILVFVGLIAKDRGIEEQKECLVV